MFDQEKILAIINKYQKILDEGLLSGVPKDYASLKEYVLLLELQNELSILRNIDNIEFVDALKRRLVERSLDKATCLSPAMMAESIVNEMYWNLVIMVIKPSTLAQGLSLFYPNAQFLCPSVPDDIPEFHQTNRDKRSYMKNRQVVLYHTKSTFQNVDDLLKELARDELRDANQNLMSSCTEVGFLQVICVGDVVFDLANIKGLPLVGMVNLMSILKEKYPLLHTRLSNHNETMKGFVLDMNSYQNIGITPRKALEALSEGLMLGGEQLTGGKYSSMISQNAIFRFFDYFNALPQETKDAINALGGLDKLNVLINEQPVEGGLIIRLQAMFKKGECVETTSKGINDFLSKNTPNDTLDGRTSFSESLKKRLSDKYFQNNQEWIQSPPDGTLKPINWLPSQWLQEAVAKINLHKSESMAMFLLNFPAEYYEHLCAAFKPGSLQNETMNRLASIISLGYLTPEKKSALANAIANHYQRLRISTSSIISWAVSCQDCLFVEVISNKIEKTAQLSAINIADDQGCILLHHVAKLPVLLNKILSIYPDDERLAAVMTPNNNGKTTLHMASTNSDSWQVLLSLLPDNERQMVQSIEGKLNTIILRYVARDKVALKTSLLLYPEKVRLLAAKINFLLHCVVSDSDSVKLLLDLYPDDNARLAAIEEKNPDGKTVLYCAAPYPDSLRELLSIYPIEKRFAAVMTPIEKGTTTLHMAIKNNDSWDVLLSLLPDNERQIVQSIKDEPITILLHQVVNDKIALKNALAIYPEKVRLLAVNSINSFGNSVLYSAANYHESLKLLLEVYPNVKAKIAAIEQKSVKGTNVLHQASGNHESVALLLNEYLDNNAKRAAIEITDSHNRNLLHHVALNHESVALLLNEYPDNDAKRVVIEAKDIDGRSVLYYATGNHQSLALLLSAYANDDAKRAVIQLRDNNGITVLHKAALNQDSLSLLLKLYPDDDANAKRAAIETKDNQGRSVLYFAALNQDSLSLLLELYPNDNAKRAAIETKDNLGITVLHDASGNDKSLALLLKLYPDDNAKRMALEVKDRFCQTALHYINDNMASMASLLALYPTSEERLKALASRDSNGQTIVHKIIQTKGLLIKFFEILNDKERLAVLLLKNKGGHTVFYEALFDFESLVAVLGSVDINDRIKVVLSGRCGNARTVLIGCCNDDIKLRKILELLPTEARREAIISAYVQGYSLLYSIVNKPKCFEVTLELLPVEHHYEVMQITSPSGMIILHYAAYQPQCLRAVLQVYPIDERLAAIMLANKEGRNVLDYAKNSTESLRTILELCPESSRLTLLRAMVDGKPISSLIDQNVEIEGSFVRSYLCITAHLRSMNGVTLYGVSQCFRLLIAIKYADTFDAIKLIVLKFIKEPANRELPVIKKMLGKLAPQQEDKDVYQYLCQQWGVCRESDCETSPSGQPFTPI